MSTSQLAFEESRTDLNYRESIVYISLYHVHDPTIHGRGKSWADAEIDTEANGDVGDGRILNYVLIDGQEHFKSREFSSPEKPSIAPGMKLFFESETTFLPDLIKDANTAFEDSPVNKKSVIFSSTYMESKSTELHHLFDSFLPSKHIQSYEERIKKLRKDAVEEDITINEVSVAGFWNFIFLVPNVVRGGLYLTEDGNLRAAWNDKTEDHVGIEFLDEQKVLYVIFKDTEDGGFDDEADYSDIEGVISKIKNFRLMPLLTNV